jgi:hypothetical protein
LLDEHLFVESLALIALYNDQQEREDLPYSPTRQKLHQ